MEKLKFLFTILLCTALGIPLLAQNCDEVGSSTCGGEPPVCLKEACGITPRTSGTPEPFPLCPGQTISNPVWVPFIACSSEIAFSIIPGKCQVPRGNPGGIQGAIFQQCDIADRSIVGTPSCNCTTGIMQLYARGLVIGQTYYLMIDGCDGDICPFDIVVGFGETCAIPLGPMEPISGETVVCPGSLQRYFVPAVPGATRYNWSVSNGQIRQTIGNGTIIDVLWNDAPGLGVITLEVSDFCGNSLPPVTFRVNLVDPPPTPIGPFTYCATEIGAFVPELNGFYPAGNLRIKKQGIFGECDTIYTFQVSEIPRGIKNLNATICKGDFIEIENPLGLSVPCVFNSDQAGTPCILTGASWTGCDSVVLVNLRVVEPKAIIQKPDSLNCKLTPITLDGTKSTGSNTATSFEWSTRNGGRIVGSSTGKTVVVDRPGLYILTYSTLSSNGLYCEDTAMIQVFQKITIPEISILSSANQCSTPSTFNLTASAINGIGPYTYLWSNGSSGPVINNVGSGSYTVTVTGDDGCTSAASLQLNDVPQLFANLVPQGPRCANTSTGQIQVSASGGTPGYSYIWNTIPIQTGNTATNLGSGSYTVTITDANGCTIARSVVLTAPPALNLSLNSNSPDCAGGADGSIAATTVGGTPGYTYTWSTGNSGPNLNNVGAGTYSVTVSDANACTVSQSVTLNAANAIVVSITAKNVGCNGGSDGMASANAVGGTGVYVSYLWNTTPAQTGPVATGLSAGTYTVTVTDDKGCTGTNTVTIGQPGSPLRASHVSTDASCGLSNGSIQLTVTGGTPAYTYRWPSGNSGSTQSNLTAGNYPVTITDANGCTTIYIATVSTPNALQVSVSNARNVTCNNAANGSIATSVSGGAPGYSYSWRGPGGYNASTANINNLAPGNYTLTVTDQDGCSVILSQSISEPSVLSSSITANNADCGISNGSIAVIANGGSGSYTYTWSVGSLGNTSNPTNLGVGVYSVTITDANGCTLSTSATVSNPSAPTVSAVANNVRCFGDASGSIQLTVNGGTPINSTNPYRFNWLPSLGNVEDPIQLVAGIYQVTITDGKNCSVSTTVTIGTVPALQLSGTSADASCGQRNGSVSLVVTGGTGPYQYAWGVSGVSGNQPNNLAPGTYTPTVTDANGCTISSSYVVSTPTKLAIDQFNVSPPRCDGGADGAINLTVSGSATPYNFRWSHGPITQNVSGLSEGTYTVTVTDNTGCSVESSIQVVAPDPVSIVGTITNATCADNDGQIVLNVAGGTAPYNFSWSVSGVSGQRPTGLNQGTYTVTVTDRNNCFSTYTGTIRIPDAPLLSITSNNVSCFNGSDGRIQVGATGGSAPYQFNWSASNPNNNTANGLKAGIYTVTVTDSKNCNSIEQVTLTQPDSISINALSITQATCGSPNGSIQLTATGGTAPLRYSWSNGQVTSSINGLLPAQYCVTVTDSKGCTKVSCYSVSAPDALNGTLQTTAVSCNGGTNGSIQSSITGGNPGSGYIYKWSNGSSTVGISNLSAGNYTLTVTDADGCTYVLNGTVSQPAALLANSTVTNADCQQSNGGVQLSVSGGISPYNFTWNISGPGNSPNGINLPAGVYLVTVTDANNCTVLGSGTVSNFNAPQASSTKKDVLCFGTATGSIQISANAGSPPYRYQWSHDASLNASAAANLPAGNYAITIVDDKNCIASLLQTITQPPILEDLAPLANNPECNGTLDGQLEIPISGGVGPYKYLWNTGSTSSALTGLSAGNYELTVTDANQCTLVVNAILTDPPSLSIALAQNKSVSCFGGNDARIAINVSGGTPGTPNAYSYQWDNSPSNGALLTGISAGAYTVTVSDANGCTQTLATVVTEPSALVANQFTASDYSGVNVTCADAMDGWLRINATGGTAPYNYLWSNGGSNSQINNLAPGNYSLTVTDANGCTTITSKALTSPDPIVAILSSGNPWCFKDTNGYVYIDKVNGGTPPYVYALNNQAFNQLPYFNQLKAGNYTVVIQDANGCDVEQKIALFDPRPLIIDFPYTTVTINVGDTTLLRPLFQNIPLNQSGNSLRWITGDYFIGDPYDFPVRVNPPFTTIYTLKVKDSLGCETQDQITVKVERNQDVAFPSSFHPFSSTTGNSRFTLFAKPGTLTTVKVARIFNRWGEMVYERRNFSPNDVSAGWDGTLEGQRLQPGVFVYFYELVFADGHTEIFTGDLTLIY